MSSTFSIGGLVSGLDTNTIIAQLMELERIPIRQMEARQAKLQKTDAAWQSITTRLSALRGAIDGVRQKSTWDTWFSAASSNEAAVGAAVTGSPVSGSVSFTVDQLAFATQRASADTFTGLDDTMDGRTLTIDFADGTESLAITTDAETTLADVVKQINDAGKPVKAQAIKVSDGVYELILTGKSTGTANDFTLSNVTGWTNPFTEVQAAQDAQLTLGGTNPITVTRSSNTVTDVIDGVRLDLKATTAAAVTITTARDENAAVTAVQKLVKELNETLAMVRAVSKYDVDADKAEPLAGDPTARRITQDLLTTISSTVAGLTGDYTTPGSLGISLTKDGDVTLDEAKLRTALQDDFDAVATAFTRAGTIADDRVSFINASDSTQPGTYNVTVTQAATVAEKTGIAYNPPTGPMTLSITISGKVVDVALDASHDTVTKAVDAINAELTAQGATSITAEDSGGAIKLSTAAYGSAVSFTVATTGGTGDDFGLDGTHTGQDAIAQIGDELVTGKGQVLTSTTGDTNGLVLRITATQAQVDAAAGSLDLGDLTYSRGVGGTLSSTISAFEGTTGLIASNRDTIKGQIELFQDRIDRFEVRLAAREQLLIRQFTAMEVALQQLTSQGNFLASQLASLDNNRLKQ